MTIKAAPFTRANLQRFRDLIAVLEDEQVVMHQYFTAAPSSGQRPEDLSIVAETHSDMIADIAGWGSLDPVLNPDGHISGDLNLQAWSWAASFTNMKSRPGQQLWDFMFERIWDHVESKVSQRQLALSRLQRLLEIWGPVDETPSFVTCPRRLTTEIGLWFVDRILEGTLKENDEFTKMCMNRVWGQEETEAGLEVRHIMIGDGDLTRHG
ncbi:MAG: hypothetical protein LAT62_15020 [Natronospirillum sp.]|uniref:hypothetical protein n=1 Tax=Natronospirillum sp. TaxID=2812955 RepID=UPI0025D36B39|nr:hypothetical protein [Natronospirillum sp.]MCH8553248.1 hypothetical protein [Natronospirillum sp.]